MLITTNVENASTNKYEKEKSDFFLTKIIKFIFQKASELFERFMHIISGNYYNDKTIIPINPIDNSHSQFVDTGKPAQISTLYNNETTSSMSEIEDFSPEIPNENIASSVSTSPEHNAIFEEAASKSTSDEFLTQEAPSFVDQSINNTPIPITSIPAHTQPLYSHQDLILGALNATALICTALSINDYLPSNIQTITTIATIALPILHHGYRCITSQTFPSPGVLLPTALFSLPFVMPLRPWLSATKTACNVALLSNQTYQSLKKLPTCMRSAHERPLAATGAGMLHLLNASSAVKNVMDQIPSFQSTAAPCNQEPVGDPTDPRIAATILNISEQCRPTVTPLLCTTFPTPTTDSFICSLPQYQLVYGKEINETPYYLIGKQFSIDQCQLLDNQNIEKKQLALIACPSKHLNCTAICQDIRKAARQLSRSIHPDHQSTQMKEISTKEIQRINQAKDTLLTIANCNSVQSDVFSDD